MLRTHVVLQARGVRDESGGRHVESIGRQALNGGDPPILRAASGTGEDAGRRSSRLTEV